MLLVSGKSILQPCSVRNEDKYVSALFQKLNAGCLLSVAGPAEGMRGLKPHFQKFGQNRY